MSDTGVRVLMNIGDAVELAKRGAQIARACWNAPGQYVYMVHGVLDGAALGIEPGHQLPADHPSTMGGVSIGLYLSGKVNTQTRAPYMVLRNAQGILQIGWAPTQSDLLACDWYVVTPPPVC